MLSYNNIQYVLAAYGLGLGTLALYGLWVLLKLKKTKQHLAQLLPGGGHE